MQTVVLTLQAAIDAAFGAGHRVTRDYAGVDVKTIDPAQTPFVTVVQTASHWDDPDMMGTAVIHFLVSGLVRAGTGVTSGLQTMGNNLQYAIERALFLETLPVGTAMVAIWPSQDATWLPGQDHLWVDVFCAMRVPTMGWPALS